MNRRTTCNIPIKGWLGESNAITSALSSIGTLKNRIEALSATGTMNLVITRFTTGCVSPVPLAIIFVGAPEHTFAKHIAVASSRSTLAFGPLNTGEFMFAAIARIRGRMTFLPTLKSALILASLKFSITSRPSVSSRRRTFSVLPIALLISAF